MNARKSEIWKSQSRKSLQLEILLQDTKARKLDGSKARRLEESKAGKLKFESSKVKGSKSRNLELENWKARRLREVGGVGAGGG